MSSILSDLSNIYTIIAGPSAVVMAFVAYTGWARKIISDKKWIPLTILLSLLILVSADVWVHHPNWGVGPELTIVANKKFANRTIVLDGFDYEYCDFQNVTFEFDGAPFHFVKNSVHGARFKTNNKDMEKGWFFMAKLGVLNIPVTMQENEEPVTPGATWNNK